MDTQLLSLYSVRRLRPKGRGTGGGFTASLVRNGQVVASIDCSHGDDDEQVELAFVTHAEQLRFQQHVGGMPVPTGTEPGLQEHVDDPDEAYLRSLVDRAYHHKRLSAFARMGTVFRLTNDPPGQWRRVRARRSGGLEWALQERFGAGVIEFFAP